MNEDHLQPEVGPIVTKSGLRRRSINLLPCSVCFHVVFRDEHHDAFCVEPSTLTNHRSGTVISQSLQPLASNREKDLQIDQMWLQARSSYGRVRLR
jgi:hypothetical protein